MPTYHIRDPKTGKQITLTGDAPPPTEQELTDIFAKLEVPLQPSVMHPEPTITDRLVGAIPTVGGAVGGILGGIGGTVAGVGVGGVPGALGGAALGGAGGEAAKQLINRLRGSPDVPPTMTAAATDIGKEGATQGALEGAGGLLGAGAKVAGRALMENAVRPTMSLVREFPNVIDTMIGNRIPVGRILPGMQAGSEQAAVKLGAAGRSVRALLAKAGAAGKEFTPDLIPSTAGAADLSVAQPIRELVDDLAKQPLGDAQQQQLGGMITEFLKRHPGPLSPNDVKDLKQAAQAIAKPVFKAAEKGFPVTADQTLSARFNAAIASGAKDSLETIPGVAAGEQTTKDLIGATRATKAAETRRLSLMAEGASMAVGGGAGAAVGTLLGPDSHLDTPFKQSVVGWLITRGLLSPRSMSRQGLILTSVAAREALRQFPRLAAEFAKTASPTTTPETDQSVGAAK